MTLNELIAEGELLQKKCFALSPKYNVRGVAGYLGGERSDITNWLEPGITSFVSRRHIATISDTVVGELGLDLGTVGLFEWLDEGGNPFYRVEFDKRRKLDTIKCDGTPLYASEATSFPPLPAICLYGGQRVEQWLTSLGKKRFEYQLLDDQAAREYEEEAARMAKFDSEVGIVAGGWHMLWPEDEYYMPAELTLLMMTLKEGKPAIEVWHNPARASCFAKPRIS